MYIFEVNKTSFYTNAIHNIILFQLLLLIARFNKENTIDISREYVITFNFITSLIIINFTIESEIVKSWFDFKRKIIN